MQILKMHYLESKSQNDDEFCRLLELRDKDKAKLDREWEKVRRLVDRATSVNAKADEAFADAKKRKRDSTVVESSIVRKLVKRCTCCKLCRGCEFMHEQYRRSKYGSDEF